MKKIITIFCLSLFFLNIYAQTAKKNYTVLNNNVSISERNINTVTIFANTTTHFVSPEPIEYADISSPDVQGDLPEKNIFRLRPDPNKIHPGDHFTVTIVTNSYIAVYKLMVKNPSGRDSDQNNAAYVISINPNDAVQLNQSGVLNNQQCFDVCVNAMKRKRNVFDIDTKAYGMKMSVSNIYTIGDYIIMGIEVRNKTQLQFDVDQIRFKIVDKHQVKSTVSQDIELKPFYSFNNTDGKIITKRWMNFYVFKKFTYPSQKLFTIEMTEKQYSGRKIDLKVQYNQILNSSQLD